MRWNAVEFQLYYYLCRVLLCPAAYKNLTTQIVCCFSVQDGSRMRTWMRILVFLVVVAVESFVVYLFVVSYCLGDWPCLFQLYALFV
jgi:hypothetical protein